MINLFQNSRFQSHSGKTLLWKIECEALTDADIKCLALRTVMMIGRTYIYVEGVPTGGLKFAHALKKLMHTSEGLLIVDDVLTTGASMEEQRAGREAKGIVIFARGLCPDWVTPLFQCVKGF